MTLIKNLFYHLDRSNPKLKPLFLVYSGILLGIISFLAVTVFTLGVHASTIHTEITSLNSSIQELNAKKLSMENTLNEKISSLQRTIDQLYILDSALAQIVEPSHIKTLSFKERIAFLQDEVNNQIALQRVLYLQGNELFADADPRVKEKYKEVVSLIESRYAIQSPRDADLKLKPISVELSVAQASLESGLCTSLQCRNFNNAYGLYENKNGKLVQRQFADLADCVVNYSESLNSYYAS